MPIAIQEISPDEAKRVLAIEEGHFADVKSREIAPAKPTRTIAALCNSDGGEVFIGIAEDRISAKKAWGGFTNAEDANGHLQIFEDLFPLGEGFLYSFLRVEGKKGLVLR